MGDFCFLVSRLIFFSQRAEENMRSTTYTWDAVIYDRTPHPTCKYDFVFS